MATASLSLGLRSVLTVDPEQLQLVGKRQRRAGGALRLGAMVAPVAAHGGAVVDDPEFLRLAEAVIAAFGEGDIEDGLTRAQIVERAAGHDEVDAEALDRRLDVFIELAMLQPYRDKAHQSRYVINTDSVAGHLFFRKGLSAGGIEELLQLLGATADAIETGRENPEQLGDALREQRGYVDMWTAAVNRLTDTATLGELLAERSFHDGRRLLDQVGRLVEVVVKHHPRLRVSATALSTSAHSYLTATDRLLTRVIDEGAATRNFGLLDPADYAQLAVTGTVEQLAAVFAAVVWDPPRVQVEAAEIIDALRAYRPRHKETRHPPADDPIDEEPDPLAGLEERVDLVRRQREHTAELILQGDSTAELSAHLRSTAWPGALGTVVELAALSADDASPYAIAMADTLIVDPEAHTTWTSDVALAVSRQPTPSPTMPVASHIKDASE